MWQKLHLDGELANIPDRKLLGAASRLGFMAVLAERDRGLCQGGSHAGRNQHSELSSKTMEAKKVPGLYVIGEAVDVTGWLGGYNFQWAWASGHACGWRWLKKLQPD